MVTSSETRLHADFAELTVEPGTMDVAAERRDAFSILNLLSFGGEAERHPHVPETIGALGDVVLWESTGSSVSLPFWNTNQSDDVYLYLVHGRVRVEFKEVEGQEILGTYDGRTGDLMLLPKDIAHRTYSGDGRRRISLEILRRDPTWARIGEHADVAPADELAIGDLRFDVGADRVGIVTPHGRIETPSDPLLRGLRALIAYELHLGHNEFEGGFVVHDRDDVVRIATPDGYDEEHEPRTVLSVFHALVAALQP